MRNCWVGRTTLFDTPFSTDYTQINQKPQLLRMFYDNISNDHSPSAGQNYRSLADVDIELDALNIFVGANGAGKSNIIDVLKFVRDSVVHGLDAVVLARHGMSAIRRWSSKGAPYDVSIQLSMQNDLWLGEYGFTLGSER
jgi:hypothetical protein